MADWEPEVKLVNCFHRAFDNAVATARTCYSAKGIVTAEQVGGTADTPEAERAKKHEKRDSLAQSIYDAGHHTTLQHAHYQFTLDKISRQFIWTFLHSHPYYNSEQVSQRYVEVKPGNVGVPPLKGEALNVYLGIVEEQMRAYQELVTLLAPVAEAEYFKIFPARRKAADKYRGAVQKKAQEIARYVLPLATFAYMYHTISGITLLRYHRICRQFDAPWEQRLVVEKMAALMVEADPGFRAVLEEPLELEDTPEYRFYAQAALGGRARGAAFAREFDAQLGGRVSKLTGYKNNNEELLADAVREVLGRTRGELDDDTAIALALAPERNTLLGEKLNLNSLSKLGRALVHPSYTFKKKISHCGDSQDQRHRMTPASRPLMALHGADEPDVITPDLVRLDSKALGVYNKMMNRAWEAAGRLRALGVAEEFVMYVLPNAVAVRFSESADLLNLHHKLKARLCYNAQEEIWRASLDETRQILAVNPRIGKYLLPPCGLRLRAKSKPICPEGERYCGVPVWRLGLDEYKRVL